jgi:hypothetical protein
MSLRRAQLSLTFALAACTQRVPYEHSPSARPYARNAVASFSAGSAEAAIAAVNASENRCRQGRSVRSYAIERLDAIRAALAPACEFRATDASGLRFRLTCEGLSLFELGKDRLDATFESALPRGAQCPSVRAWPQPSRFACAGEILANRTGARALRVAVLGTVDRVQLVGQQLGCSDLPPPFGSHPAARAWDSRTDSDWVSANDRLAYCRAARVAHAIQHGITALFRDPSLAGQETNAIREVDFAVFGASDVLFSTLNECRSSARGHCPAARRVELLLEVVPAAVESLSRCDEQRTDAATALFCLQDCVAGASAEVRSAAPWAPPREELPTIDFDEAPCWHYASTRPRAGRPRWLSPASILTTLGLDPTPRCGQPAVATSTTSSAP